MISFFTFLLFASSRSRKVVEEKSVTSVLWESESFGVDVVFPRLFLGVGGGGCISDIIRNSYRTFLRGLRWTYYGFIVFVSVSLQHSGV